MTVPSAAPEAPSWEFVERYRDFIDEKRQTYLNEWKANPDRLLEDANRESGLEAGGYSHTQVRELLQNALDASVAARDQTRVRFVLTEDVLYCANTGQALDEDALRALLALGLSSKEDQQIGRFGVGFKCLLAISDRVDVLSRTASLRFDGERSHAAIVEAGIAMGGKGHPRMRLAWCLDAPAEIEGDAILSDLARWASTVIRVHLRDARTLRAVLQEQVRNVRAETFLLLGRSARLERCIVYAPTPELPVVESVKEGATWLLLSGDELSTWRRFSRICKIEDQAALQDAGKPFRRDTYDVVWLVSDARKHGEFWSWFRLAEHARIPGVLHAPFKVNDDRTNLVDGAFNRALAKELADLVVTELASGGWDDGTDPACRLDFLPILEGGNEFSAQFAEMVWNRTREARLLPDQHGLLRSPSEVRLHPVDANADLVTKWLQSWSGLPGSGNGPIAHATCYRDRTRVSRVTKLAHICQPSVELPKYSAWLKAVAAVHPAEAVKFLHLLGDVAKTLPANRSTELDLLRTMEIVPDHVGALRCPSKLRFSSLSQAPPDIGFIPKDIAGNEGACKVLRDVLGVQDLAAKDWASAIKGMPRGEAQWMALRRASEEVITLLLAEDWRPSARNVAGTWMSIWDLLLPGGIVPANEVGAAGNKEGVVDLVFHEQDVKLLKRFGAKDEPLGELDANNVDLLSSVLTQRRSAFRQKYLDGWYPAARTPQLDKLGWLGARVPWPISLIKTGASRTRAALTKWIAEGPMESQSAEFGHLSRGDSYHKENVPHPTVELLGHGLVRIGSLFLDARVAMVVARNASLTNLLGREEPTLWKRLEEASRVFPQDKLTDIGWIQVNNAANGLLGLSDDERRIGYREVLAGLCSGPPNGRDWLGDMVCLLGESRFSVGDAVMCEEPVIFHALAMAGEWVLEVTEPVAKWMRANGMPPGVFSLARENEHRSGFCDDEVLSGCWKGAPPDQGWCREADGLAWATADAAWPCDAAWEGDVLLLRAELDECTKVHALCGALEKRGFLTCSPEEAVSRLLDRCHEKLRAEVRDEPTLVGKILRIVKLDPSTLMELFDADDRTPKLESGDKEAIAGAFLGAVGCDALRRLENVLRSGGFLPPKGREWGGDVGVAFALELGFPDEFGGRRIGREATLQVLGPFRLPPLRAHQQAVVDELHSLLCGTGRRRAMVCLPTGSGKTRAVVQAVVEFLASDALERDATILWVAQSDELLEQAVLCFQQVWWTHGRERTPLTVSRMWADARRRVTKVSGPHVVVASIQSLYSRREESALDWLCNAAVVVIDEAHHALTKSYTELLARFAPDGPLAPCVLGLTATPFRGRNHEATRLLLARFDDAEVPRGEDQRDLVRRLQDEGVLAEAKFDPVMNTHVEVPFDETDSHHFNTWSELSKKQKNRLADDGKRNALIVQKLLEENENARICVFAINVRHARWLATTLNLRGRRSAAVYGKSPRHVRRHHIEQFRSGDLRILVSCDVLTTGFDAPETDVIVITCPTFSVNRYQQMIGRGLRGRVVGGTENCKIITWKDNLERFGEHLVFNPYKHNDQADFST